MQVTFSELDELRQLEVRLYKSLLRTDILTKKNRELIKDNIRALSSFMRSHFLDRIGADDEWYAKPEARIRNLHVALKDSVETMISYSMDALYCTTPQEVSWMRSGVGVDARHGLEDVDEEFIKFETEVLGKKRRARV